jgi:hypothetical protein
MPRIPARTARMQVSSPARQKNADAAFRRDAAMMFLLPFGLVFRLPALTRWPVL